jgi:hypothetical protein
MDKAHIQIDPEPHAELRAYCDDRDIRFVDVIRR